MEIIILTRFNIPLNFTRQNVSNKSNCHEWLNHRIKIFNTYCLPSIENQTCKNFKWKLGFAKETPNEIINSLPLHYEAIRCNSMEEFKRNALEGMRSKNLLTVRLDNDDSLSKYFIETCLDLSDFLVKSIHHSANFPFLINFDSGAEFDVLNKKVYTKQAVRSNCSALIESYDPSEPSGYKTIYSGSQSKLHDKYPCIHIPSTKPMWMINVHGMNVANKISSANEISLPGDITERFTHLKNIC